MKSMLKNIKKKFSSEDGQRSRAGSRKPSLSGPSGQSSGLKPSDLGVDRMSLSQQSGLSRDALLKPIPTFQETPVTGRSALFIQKLQLCSIQFDWKNDKRNTNNQKSTRGKEVKRQLLLEMVDYIGKNKNIYTEQVLEELMNMVAANLFRDLPPRLQAADPEEDEPFFEPSWPHLQIVYEFFLRFIVGCDVEIKNLKKFINQTFVLHLLELFDSEDPRERDYLKTILHRIYAKHVSIRAFIRKSINNVFHVFMYETERFNGIADLLEILGSIINGFALPLKAEHSVFFTKVLVPLHKVRGLAAFHQQLSYCITQFVDKDPTLAVPVVLGLCRFWPRAQASKEVMLLNELEEILELTQAAEFQQLLVPLFRCVRNAIDSSHFQVAERGLFLWHNEYVSNMIANNRQDILKSLYPVLFYNSTNHWNATIKTLSGNVLKIFVDLDSSLVDKCKSTYTTDNANKKTLTQRRQDGWKKFETQVSKKK